MMQRADQHAAGRDHKFATNRALVRTCTACFVISICMAGVMFALASDRITKLERLLSQDRLLLSGPSGTVSLTMADSGMWLSYSRTGRFRSFKLDLEADEPRFVLMEDRLYDEPQKALIRGPDPVGGDKE